MTDLTNLPISADRSRAYENPEDARDERLAQIAEDIAALEDEYASIPARYAELPGLIADARRDYDSVSCWGVRAAQPTPPDPRLHGWREDERREQAGWAS